MCCPVGTGSLLFDQAFGQAADDLRERADGTLGRDDEVVAVFHARRALDEVTHQRLLGRNLLAGRLAEAIGGGTRTLTWL